PVGPRVGAQEDVQVGYQGRHHSCVPAPVGTSSFIHPSSIHQSAVFPTRGTTACSMALLNRPLPRSIAHARRRPLGAWSNGLGEIPLAAQLALGVGSGPDHRDDAVALQFSNAGERSPARSLRIRKFGNGAMQIGIALASSRMVSQGPDPTVTGHTTARSPSGIRRKLWRLLGWALESPHW